MPSRVVVPQTRLLKISQGDWLLVKKRLSAGEQRSAYARTVKHMRAGEQTEYDPEQLGLQRAIAYLLDWSLVDPAGKQIVIRDQSPDVVAAALNSIDPDDFTEILTAIDVHVAEMDAERAAEKKDRDGENTSPATSPSPSTAAGDTSGSES